MSNLSNKVEYISINKIKPNPYQPRKTFNTRSLEELSQSIKSYGVLQPISIRKLRKDSYELVAGERRLRASELAELERIPAIIVNLKEEDAAVLALVENLQREDLNFLEEAEAYHNLMNDHGITQQKLAEKVGKNQSTVANKLRILKLSSEVKQKLVENNLTERHGRALLKLPDEELQLKVLERVIKNELNVKKTEDVIKNVLEEIIKENKISKRQKMKSMINYRIYLNTIRNAYDEILNSGVDAEYEQTDKGEFIEVIVKIPKNKKNNHIE